LWARDAEKLQDTERAVHAAAKEYKGNVQTFPSSVDLGSQASYVGHVESLVQKVRNSSTIGDHHDKVLLYQMYDMTQLQAHEPPYETIYVVHNAASMGQLGCTDVWASASDLADYWELSLTYVCFFNARLLAALKHSHRTHLVLVNVSSAAAKLAVGGMGLYCTAKAAREMHFRVIAEEYKGEKRVRVLNYGPGAMDTDMQTELRASTATPETMQALFKAFKEEVRSE
jgi:sepiapterin reductase